jgi:hypothetical protein
METRNVNYDEKEKEIISFAKSKAIRSYENKFSFKHQ